MYCKSQILIGTLLIFGSGCVIFRRLGVGVGRCCHIYFPFGVSTCFLSVNELSYEF